MRLSTLLLGIVFMISSLNIFSQVEPTDTDGDGYINVSTLEHLRWISENEQSWDWNFELDNDIDASDTKNWNIGDHDVNPSTPDSEMGWKPIGYFDSKTEHSAKFSGSFDGNGFVIKNLYINRPELKYVGFFGLVDDGKINNLGLINVQIIGLGQVGSIAGWLSNSILTESYATGNVKSERWGTGGLVGHISEGLIHNCYSRVDILMNLEKFGEEVWWPIGGIAGYFSGYISNSYSTGTVNGDPISGVLGAIGFNKEIVKNSFWDMETSGIERENNDYGEGKKTSDMKDINTFLNAGWDFDNIWNIDPNINNGYPNLEDVKYYNISGPKLECVEVFDLGNITTGTVEVKDLEISNEGDYYLIIEDFDLTVSTPSDFEEFELGKSDGNNLIFENESSFLNIIFYASKKRNVL